MALINCPECNHEVSDKAKVCLNCGCPVRSKQRKKVAVGAINATGEIAVKVKRRMAWKIILVVLVAIVVVVVGGFYIFRDFWAKIFMDSETYKAYCIYKDFKKTNILNEVDYSCGTFYLQKIPKEDMYHYEDVEGYDDGVYYLRWKEKSPRIEYYCECSNYNLCIKDYQDDISMYAITIFVSDSFKNDNRIEELFLKNKVIIDEFSKINNFYVGEENGVVFRYKSNIDKWFEDIVLESTYVNIPFLFR